MSYILTNSVGPQDTYFTPAKFYVIDTSMATPTSRHEDIKIKSQCSMTPYVLPDCLMSRNSCTSTSKPQGMSYGTKGLKKLYVIRTYYLVNVIQVLSLTIRLISHRLRA